MMKKSATKRQWSTRTSYSNVAKQQLPAELDTGSSANARRLEHELGQTNIKLALAHKTTMVSLNHRRKQMEDSMLKYSERMREISGFRTTKLFKQILEQKFRTNSCITDAASELRYGNRSANFWKQSNSTSGEILSEFNGRVKSCKRMLEGMKYKRLSKTLPNSLTMTDIHRSETPKTTLPLILPAGTLSIDAQRTNSIIPVGTRDIVKYSTRYVVRKHG